jgi:predicted ATPase/class 3 adenylate cyclase
MTGLPQGTVTFLFTDVEGSTRLLHELGNEYAEVLARHRRALRDAFARHHGVEVDTQGDAFFVVFAKASDALAAAAAGREALREGPIRVRMGLHTGEPVVTDEGYVGIDVHRAARIAAAGHGGQILVSQSTHDLLRAYELRDLGEHRLRDLSEPERIYQLGEEDFPPLKSLDRNNLPQPPNPLIGRKKELADVLRLLRGDVRLVTVSGPGGVGKTRFALDVAAELTDRFADGVWWVGLAPMRESALVLSTIGAAIGAKHELSSELAGKSLLLLLDNFEQVVEAASDLADLQRSCPEVALLVTSREPLHIGGEHVYPLRPLPESPAVELFRQRAEAVSPGFDADYGVLTEVCERVDGLPLAIELAAARTKTLSVVALLDRLEQRLPLLTSRRRDVDGRQRTLRATIEWSYDLLDAQDRMLFTQLAIFAGSFDIGAAEVVCDADLDVLQSLVDKSLLRRSEDERYFMLETIREFALERLRESCADEMGARHAEWALARAAYPGDDLLGWLADVDRDYSNFEAALNWLVTHDADDVMVKLVSRLGLFWDARARLSEGRRWLEAALERAPPTASAERAEILSRLGHLAWRQGDLATSSRAAEAALADAREIGDVRLTARQHMFRAGNALSAGDLDTAASQYGQAIDMLHDLGVTPELVTATHDLGIVRLLQDELDGARALVDEALALSRSISHLSGEANALSTRGFIELRLSRFDRAHELLLEALGLEQAAGLTAVGTATNLVGLAAIALARADFEHAGKLIGAYDAYQARIGADHDPTVQRLYRDVVARLDDGAVDAEASRAAGARLSLVDAVEYALAGDT